ncbi:hypothetical protein [Rhizobium sp. Leaf341]|uniref:hypothetical protein n=1 Tax=Rhizobium sp. Leaf341 TaxID=1736344 RepID=UPI00071589AD|nr:hypothetical protein [Rhizobium sp. Leaf341]KQR78023.1 hypothetical protein ASG03_16940 [Rhizobium sp. Leaf341]
MQTSTAISRSAPAALTDGGTAKDRQALPAAATKRFDTILHVIEIVLRDMPNADPATRVALARLTDALARIVDLPPQPQETLRDFTRRLAAHMDVLPPAARALIEKQLNQQPLLAALKMLVETLRPALTIDLRIDMPLTRDGLWHPDAVSALFPDEDDRPAFHQPTIQVPLPTRMAFSQAPGVAPGAPHLQQALGKAFSPETTGPSSGRPEQAPDPRPVMEPSGRTGSPLQTANEPVPPLRKAVAFLASDAQALAQAAAIARDQSRHGVRDMAHDMTSDMPREMRRDIPTALPSKPLPQGQDGTGPAESNVGDNARGGLPAMQPSADRDGTIVGATHRGSAQFASDGMGPAGAGPAGLGRGTAPVPETPVDGAGIATSFSAVDDPEERLAQQQSIGNQSHMPDHPASLRTSTALGPASSGPVVLERYGSTQTASASSPADHMDSRPLSAAPRTSETITFQARPLVPAQVDAPHGHRPESSQASGPAQRNGDAADALARRIDAIPPQVEIALMTPGMREVANAIGQLDEWETLFYMLSGSLGETPEALLPQETLRAADHPADATAARPQNNHSTESDLLTVMDEDRASRGLAPQATHGEDIAPLPGPPRGLDAILAREAVGYAFVPYLTAADAGKTEDEEPRAQRRDDEAGFAQSEDGDTSGNDREATSDKDEAALAETAPPDEQAEVGRTDEMADGARHDAYDLYQRLSDLA